MALKMGRTMAFINLVALSWGYNHTLQLLIVMIKLRMISRHLVLCPEESIKANFQICNRAVAKILIYCLVVF